MNPAEAAVAEDAEDVAFLRLTDDVFPPETERFNVSVGYLRSYKPYGNFTVEARGCGATHALALAGHWDLPYTLAQDAVVVPRTACRRVRVTVVPTSPAPANADAAPSTSPCPSAFGKDASMRWKWRLRSPSSMWRMHSSGVVHTRCCTPDTNLGVQI